jgi:hypothetical protein
MVPESLSQIRYEISSLHKDKEQKSHYDLDSQTCEKITKILSIQFPEIYQRLEDSVPGGSGSPKRVVLERLWYNWSNV